MKTTVIPKFYKAIFCPNCRRKLCKITTEGRIEMKHKGAYVISADAIVGCVYCKKKYYITADGVKDEYREKEHKN